jgi:nitronate monooxygenase
VTPFGSRYPIIQAPMAGVVTAELVAAVSDAGALGMIGVSMQPPEEVRAEIRAVRERTDAPFGVNVFAPPYLRDGVLDVVLEEAPAVFSFAFGPLETAALREEGIVVLGTATTPEEAQALDVDFVVAQGAEAGGHRGTFLGSFEDGLIPLEELVRAIDQPVIAAGGIMDGHDIRRAFQLGAVAVQLGTAFLFCPESAASPQWKRALREHETVVTPAYTGRHARAARTPFLQQLMDGPPPLAFPEQRKVSAALPDAEGFFMGGTEAARARELPAAELVAALVDESRA